ncbi:MAG TPA: polymorphic toxin-type HINT domain-containing protein [Candidatus Omnitrophota bacterium]|nr:polymorphic toxin-type HINT domain-containing protein [Candidatus Omnitrophota bacterium]HPD84640.1 polymorphic toxin-type HINT domain-containing protein [Candidatus Omnitrophota bacterium]HRZ03498.1 polymorphic toxin-type HINT domain-containing protein [Candidatus Omnitrophota bacterium]
MKRALTIGALIVGLFLSVGTQAWATNLFTDPGFENGVNNWSTVGYPFYAIVHSPNYAAENTITTVADRDYFAEIYQVITPVAAGDPIYMTAQIKTQMAEGSSARGGIMVEFLNSSDVVVGTITTPVGGVNDWTEIYVTGTAPTGTAKVRAGAFAYAAKDDSSAIGGKVAVDNMFIDRIQAPGGGLITNPGFESQLSGWAGNSQFSASTTYAHTGVYSARDNVNGVTSDYWGQVYQEVPLSAGQAIYATAWGKTAINPLASAKGGLLIQFYNGNTYLGSQYDIKSEIGGMTDWRQLYVSGIAPATTTKIRVGGFLWAGQNDTAAVGGNFYIDDFAVSYTAIPPLLPPSDLINADFENGVNDWTFLYRPWIASTTHHSGIYSANHTIGDTAGSNDYYTELYQQDIPFTVGNTAYVTGWVKTNIDPSKIARGGVKIQFLDGSGQPIGSAQQADIGGQTDWSLLYVYNIAPTGTATVRISAYAWAQRNQGTINGNVFVDDMAFSNTPPSDLILNPSFESDMAGWTQDATGYPMAAVTEEHRTGTKSAKSIIQVPGGSADFWSRIYQEFTVTPGQQLWATEWAKTVIDPRSSATAGLQLEFFEADGTPIGSPVQSNTIGGITGWTYLFVTAVAPSSSAKARVSPFVSCPHAASLYGGNIYFDDVFASFDQLPPPNFRTSLVNPNFDDGSGLGGWTDLYGAPSELDSVNPHSSPYSAKKTIGSTTTQNYYSTIYQDIYYNAQGSPFPAAQNVYLTAYLKSDISVFSSAAAGIQLEYIDNQGDAYVIDADQITADNGWRQLYVSGTIPAGATKVRVSGFVFASQGDSQAVGGIGNFDNFVYSYDYISPPAQTTLLNSGFENGLSDWDMPFQPAEVTTLSHSGSYAALFEFPVSLQDHNGAVEQTVNVTPGRKLTATIYGRTIIDPLATASAQLLVIFKNSSGAEIGTHSSNTIGGNTPWTLLSVSNITIPSTAATATIRANLFYDAVSYPLPAQAYFDDATLTITSAPGCFLAGTPITMADGTQKPIENISVGDVVLAFDEETKQMKPDKVTEVFKHDQEDTFLIVNGHMKVTPIHRVLSKGAWTEIGKLKVGDTLTNTQGEDVAIQTIEVVNNKVNIYNFEVNPYHTYVADGVIVHNRKPNINIMMVPDGGQR